MKARMVLMVRIILEKVTSELDANILQIST